MKSIEHKAVVVSVERNIVEVEMTVNEACHECRAKDLCGATSGEKRVVAVHDTFAKTYIPGEEVIVTLDEIMGVKAVIYAYIIPFFIMITVLFGTKAFETSDEEKLYWEPSTKGIDDFLFTSQAKHYFKVKK